MPISTDALFQIANITALVGWISLVLYPLAPKIVTALSGYTIPLILSLGYCTLVLVFWSGGQGGYDSLVNVAKLFQIPEILLAGWIHYLAFDLFIGAWIARQARARGIHHLLIIPIFALTFLFGPIGLLTFWGLSTAYKVKTYA